MDRVSQQRQIFSSSPNPPELFEWVDRSQLEEKYGGTQPNCTVFWPPRDLPMPEECIVSNEMDKVTVVPRTEYVEFWTKNQTLTPMPKEMRMDLQPLHIDPTEEMTFEKGAAEVSKNTPKNKPAVQAMDNSNHTEQKPFHSKQISIQSDFWTGRMTDIDEGLMSPFGDLQPQIKALKPQQSLSGLRLSCMNGRNVSFKAETI